MGHSFTFRTYALRRIKDGFKQHKTESDPETIKSLVKHAEDNLEVIKRQVKNYGIFTSLRPFWPEPMQAAILPM